MRLTRFGWSALASAGAVAITTAGFAAAADREQLSFSVSPDKAGRSQTVRFAFDSTAPWSTSDVSLTLPPGTVWNGGRFPRCSLRTLLRVLRRAADGVPNACPRGSRVGSGHATILHVVNPTFTLRERVRVTAVNGGGTVHLVMLGRYELTVEGKTIQRTRVAVWRAAPSRLGRDTEWLQVSGPMEFPGDRAVKLEHLDLAIGNTRKSRGALELGSCPTGRWRASISVRYYDLAASEEWQDEWRGTGRATDSVRCSA